MRDAAVAYIIDDPGQFLSHGLGQVRPHVARVAESRGLCKSARGCGSVLSFVPVLLLAAIGLVLTVASAASRAHPAVRAGLHALHMALVGTIRYRLPLEAFLICFSGVAISALVQTSRRTA